MVKSTLPQAAAPQMWWTPTPTSSSHQDDGTMARPDGSYSPKYTEGIKLGKAGQCYEESHFK